MLIKVCCPEKAQCFPCSSSLFPSRQLHLADPSCLFVSMLFPVSVIESLCCVSTLELLLIELWDELSCLNWNSVLGAGLWPLYLRAKKSATKSRIRATPPSDQGFVVSHML